ncbi:hypothetical protein D3C78_1648850 [compost metagenome]
MTRGCHDIKETRFLHRRQDPFGAERRLERRHEFAAEKLGLGVAELVVFGVVDAHGGILFGCDWRGQPTTGAGLLAISACALFRPAGYLLPASGAKETRGTRSLQQQHR